MILRFKESKAVKNCFAIFASTFQKVEIEEELGNKAEYYRM